ncbi:ABC transporter permease [Spirochaetia bacterium]|nr:ABC transporter permease [Spirochaetia bacterium]
MNSRKKAYCVFIYAVSFLLCAFALFPIVWDLSTSLKPDKLIFSQPPQWIPETFTLEHYFDVLRNDDMVRYFVNTAITAIWSTLVALLIGVLGAYGFSRHKFPGNKGLLISVMLVRLLPRVSILVPFFIILQKLHMYNTRPGLVLVYMVITMPLSLWMLKGFFDSIPAEIEEAALVDGCSPLGILFRIDLPMILPAVASVGMYIFITAWNEFLISLTMTKGKALRSIAVGLAFYIDELGVRWGSLMAASILMSIPAMLVFSIFSKFLIKGLSEGGVKG